MNAPLRTAIIYDFDGTLAPHNLPEHSFLPAVGVTDSQIFWDRVHEEARAQDGCHILAYMQLMLEAARNSGVEVTRAMLQKHGQDIPLFAGVSEWFDHIDAYGREKNLELEHYVISSGILEIIEGCPIYSRFRKVFAS
ncbi:MAG: haloacid dehalogenase-like hydrolase, partial [Planctomycetes bacterium]|nr:haloacid dehalogenase-like hydrolase [Planctomycetota bacterium]